jgi:dephospho-CoA kinase
VSERRSVPVIGLIGGIGSGKSAVARSLQQRLPIAIVEGDEAGHRALTQPVIQEQIRRRFGDSVFTPQGEIDRKALGSMVFGATAERRQARADLERIVHPAIRQQLQQAITDHRNRGAVEAIILDAAVMLEAGWNSLCNTIVFVDAPYDQRLKRVSQHRGWTAADLQEREASQLPLETKQSAANHVIDNSGTLDEATRQLQRIITRLTQTTT